MYISLHISQIAFARLLIHEQIGIDRLVKETQSSIISVPTLTQVILLLTSLLLDHSLSIESIPPISFTSTFSVCLSQNRDFIETWSQFILAKLSRCIFLRFLISSSSTYQYG